MTPRQVRIGKIVGFHGVRGEVKVRPASDDAAWAESLKRVFVKNPKGNDPGKLMHIAGIRPHGPNFLMLFDGFGNRTLVESMLGAELFADLSELPPPEEGEYWADDLIGLTVVDKETGRKRGVVKDLLSSGGSDFLEIQLEESPETVVIPFIDRFFPEVSLEAKTVSVDLLTDFLNAEPVTTNRIEE